MSFTDIEIKTAWNNASSPTEGYDKKEYRLDACGALMYWKSYGRDTNMGWEVDHVFPEEKGGDKSSDNLRAMQHQNNSSKSDSYPDYKYVVKYSAITEENEPESSWKTVNGTLRAKLKKLYGEDAA